MRSIKIVVGVDGSHDGLRAAEYAACEAAARGQGVLLVHAYHPAVALNPTLPWYGVDELRRFGERALDSAEQVVEEAAPSVPVEGYLVRTSAAKALVRVSAGASMVVVGRRHRHLTGHVFSGSTGAAVAARAKAPLVTVPDGWTRRSRAHHVVVGADGSSAGHDALAFALSEAELRRASLTVVRVWETPPSWHEAIHALDDADPDWVEQAERDLAEELAGWLGQYPDVAVHRRIERSRWAAEALVDVAADAGLLVVGARGLGGLRGLDLGETARSVIAHSGCPVAVVHQGDVPRTRDLVDERRRELAR